MTPTTSSNKRSSASTHQHACTEQDLPCRFGLLDHGAQAAFVFTHSGSNDPASEGSTVLGPGSNVTAGPVTNDLGTGLNAWNVNDPTTGGGSTLQYQRFPTNAQATSALNYGWQMDIRLRVVNTPDAPDA